MGFGIWNFGFAALLCLTLAACSSDRSGNTSAPTPERTNPNAATGGEELRFAVASMVSPAATWESYEGILRYLSESLGRPYRLIQRRTYKEINELLLAGEIDLAFVCSGTYAALPSNAPVELIAVPVVNDRAVYHSVIITRDKSPYRTFSDLRGARFAFSDELSNTGHIYPRWLLAESGEEPGSFFSGTIFTGSHDKSILAVYRHLADAAAVHELVYRAVVVPGSPYWGKLKIIDTSPDFATPPVVAPTALPAGVRARIKTLLTDMGGTEEGRSRLKSLGFDGFAPARPEDYLPIRKMLRKIDRR